MGLKHAHREGVIGLRQVAVEFAGRRGVAQSLASRRPPPLERNLCGRADLHRRLGRALVGVTERLVLLQSHRLRPATVTSWHRPEARLQAPKKKWRRPR